MAEVRPIDGNLLLECLRSLKNHFQEKNEVLQVLSIEFVLSIFETEGVLPTIDYEPVRHGEWVARKEIFDGEQEPADAIGCSQCGKSQRVFRRTPYCPNCGAKMDGGARR